MTKVGVALVVFLLSESTLVMADDVRIRIGPNILVSRDGDIPHIESHLAAHPNDAKNLLGAAMVFSKPFGGIQTKTYASVDGGYRWKSTEFPEQVRYGGADPQVEFGASGTAYFATLSRSDDEFGTRRNPLHLYRSEDGGLSWSDVIDLGSSYDHPQIAVDRTDGNYAGRLYLSVLYGSGDYKIGVFFSDDDGHTFSGPIEATRGGGNRGLNTTSLLVFSDGELFLPFVDFQIKRKDENPETGRTFWFVTSNDGGNSFSEPRKIAKQLFLDRSKRHLQLFPKLAIDSSGGPYNDWIYAVWDDMRHRQLQILLSYSKNRGKSWSEPTPIVSKSAADGYQFQPALFVNNKGVLGITWYDTRGTPGETQFHQYFVASINGGETISSPVRVSSQPSLPYGPGNLRVNPVWQYNYPAKDIPEESVLVIPMTAWPTGGDYMGLTADSGGTFHPFWADARTGTFEIWTASVDVDSIVSRSGIGDEKNSRSHINLVHSSITSKIRVLFDPSRYDPEYGVLELPIRLENVSSKAIFPPLTVTVQALSPAGEGTDPFMTEGRELIILNSSNGKSGDDAVFDYSAALGDHDSLPPGGQTEAITWRLRVLYRLATPFFTVTANGMIDPAGAD